MHRRAFIRLLGAGSLGVLAACTVSAGEPDGDDEVVPDAGSPAGDGSPPLADAASADACVPASVLMHDTNAQALYLDGTFGPLTGVIEVAFIAAGTARTLDFWHGHGGQLHRFTLTPAHFAALLSGERVYVTTSEVEDHMHTLFIDPLDEDYRVAGAPDVEVAAGGC